MTLQPNEFSCPQCGAEISPNARSCARCGARKEGAEWLGAERYDGVDLGEDEFDYEDFVRREFGKGGDRNWFSRLTPKERFWWTVAVVLLVAFVLAYAVSPRSW